MSSVRRVVLGAVAAMTAVSTVATALTPTLATRSPLALIAIEAAVRNLLLARAVPVVPYVLVATARRLFASVLYFFLGRLYGDDAVAYLSRRSHRSARTARAIERVFARTSWAMVFLLPIAAVDVLAGATGMPLALFVALSASGSATVALVVRWAGARVAGPLDILLGYFARSAGVATALVIALLAGSWLWRGVHKRRTTP